jgi:hypothetical protein
MHRGEIAREMRRQQAFALKEERNARTTTEQLALLAKRPGSSIKEKARLLKLLKEKD